MTENRGKCLEEVPFASKSDPSKPPYKVKVWENGEITCDCPRWTFKRSGEERSCSHVIEVASRRGISPPQRVITTAPILSEVTCLTNCPQNDGGACILHKNDCDRRMANLQALEDNKLEEQMIESVESRKNDIVEERKIEKEFDEQYKKSMEAVPTLEKIEDIETGIAVSKEEELQKWREEMERMHNRRRHF